MLVLVLVLGQPQPQTSPQQQAPAISNPPPFLAKMQARRESNPQPPVLETGALPIELLTYVYHSPHEG